LIFNKLVWWARALAPARAAHTLATAQKLHRYEDIGDTLVSAWSPVSVACEQAVDERECRAEWMICMPLGHMAEPAA